MGWKEWPYWLKGMIMGLLFYFLAGIFSIFSEMLFCWTDGTAPAFCTYSGLFLTTVFSPFPFPNIFSYSPLLVVAMIKFVLFGALIGFTIGKLKKKEFQ